MAFRPFVLFLTFSVFLNVSCGRHLSGIQGKNAAVTDAAGLDASVEAMIQPYRDKIEADMQKVLAYAREDIDKSGKWQTPIGNFFAQTTLEAAAPVFRQRTGKVLDFCLLNSGGVRSIIPKGPIVTRTAYELMPFENELVVAELAPEQIREILAYFITDKKPHPIAGLTFTIRNGLAENVTIGGKPWDPNKSYFVVTSDYLYNGGDNMLFFGKSVSRTNLDYKLRNVLLDRFAKGDTIRADRSVKITVE